MLHRVDDNAYASQSELVVEPSEVKPRICDDEIKHALMNRKLTSPSWRSDSRPSSSRPILSTAHTTTTAISGSFNNNIYTTRYDGQLSISARFSPLENPETINRQHVHPDHIPERQSSFVASDFTRHGHLNNIPRVSTHSDLAAHYGLPTFLPPAPSTKPRRPQPELDPLTENYLMMLQQSGSHQNNMASATTDDDLVRQMEASVSPEFRDASEFLTSPFTSPESDFLPTPQMDSMGNFNTSPLINDYDFMSPVFDDFDSMDPSKVQYNATISPMMTLANSFDSPPLPQPVPLPTVAAPRRKVTNSNVTGTRKNVTPATLVPIDAPTQPRKYTGPSATSRKAIPAGFAKKRGLPSSFEEDELDEAPPINASEQEMIEYKRRQNTVAARRSRKRKLEHQRELEDSVAVLTAERDSARNEAQVYQALLRSHNIPIPSFRD